jgi:FlaA1/EpsC-like NDP-sugar epimerase
MEIWFIICSWYISSLQISSYISSVEGMARVLVQGASRGIGLQFCRHILQAKPTSVVIATCRNPDAATELIDLQSQYNRRLRVMLYVILYSNLVEFTIFITK